MKVIHLMASTITSGAGLGTKRLHEGLLNLGVESFVVVGSDSEYDKGVVRANWLNKKLKPKLNSLINFSILGFKKPSFIFSLFGGFFNSFNNINYQDYDIVHIHWINGSLPLNEIKKIESNNKVLITIRDMWSFTGGCHYSLSCIQYKNSGCADCYLFSSDRIKSTIKNAYENKKNIFKSSKIIAVSEWLRNEAVESGVIEGQNVGFIYNSSK